MILAASGLSFDYIIYIAAAVWVVITWVKERKTKQEGQRTDEPTTRMPAPAPRPVEQGESEQERLRRFLEALGVPAGQQPQPPAPQPPRPVHVPTPVQPRPLPRQIPRPAVQPRPAPVVQRPAPKKARAFEPEEMQLAGRLEEPASAVEGVGTTFDNMAKGIAMEPVAELERRAEVMGRTEVSGAGAIHMGAVTSKSIHATLRSPESIRTAFVLREVLGPPRSESI